MEKFFYFYMLASKPYGTLYAGFTNDLIRRVYEHKNKLVPGFTSRYGVDQLVYFEQYGDPLNARAREKQVKGWLRVRKLRLIESINPGWTDLYSGLLG